MMGGIGLGPRPELAIGVHVACALAGVSVTDPDGGGKAWGQRR